METNGLANGMHNEGETLRELVRGLHTKMDAHAKNTERINTILFGDKEGEIKGIVAKVKEHGKYIERDKTIKWIGAGTMAAGGASMGFWEQIRNILFK